MPRFPFDWKTRIGYLICILLQFPPTMATGELFICIIIPPIGFCLFLYDFVSDIEINLRLLNANWHKTVKNSSNIDGKTEMKRKLLSIIQFHSEAKQLSVQLHSTHFHQFRSVFSLVRNRALCFSSNESFCFK